MDIDKKFRLEMNIGSLCNFRCKYCFEDSNICNYVPTKIEWDYLQKWSNYITKLRKKYPNRYLYLVIYGGEPLLQLDNLLRFMSRVHTSINHITIVTNGSLVHTYKEKILQLKQYKCNVFINVSYDFTNQNTTRQKDSYTTVRESIKWLYQQGFCRKTITVFSNKNFTTISDVYLDFVELRKELPELQLHFNIDRFKSIDIKDINAIEESLSIIKNHMVMNPCYKGSIIYNNNLGGRLEDSLDGCFFGNIHIAMAYDGSLYPGYDVIYENDTIKNLLYIGHIDESFETIEQKRQELIDKLPTQPKEECKYCFTPCRVVPWRVLKKSLSEWLDIPEGEHCKIHKLIGEYL